MNGRTTLALIKTRTELSKGCAMMTVPKMHDFMCISSSWVMVETVVCAGINLQNDQERTKKGSS